MKNPVGKKVRLKLGQSNRPGPRPLATIKNVYTSIPGGVRVEPELCGFRSWNLDALEFVGD